MSFDFSTASSLANSLSYFCGRGEDYERYRPIHPSAAIDTILSGLNPPIVAADIGAGTGIGSRLLANRGVQVFAIEPNAEMRSSATPHERVEFLAGTGEQIPLETSSVDLVTSFQAFHWFKFAKSLKEFRRILKPGGRLALIWSLWDQNDAASRAYTQLISEASKAQEQSHSKPWLESLQYQLFWRGFWLPDFKEFQQRSFSFTQELDLTGLVGLARSQGFTPSEGEAFEKLVLDLSKFCDRYCDAQGQVRLAYRTRLYLATSP